MKQSGMTLEDVLDVYSGPEGRLWELIMGEQIHAGGFSSSMALATKAGIKPGMRGVDLCSALGAGCRFLVSNFKAVMAGVDATPRMVEEAGKRAPFAEWGIEFKLASVLDVPYPSGTFDFVWGEDAWCYVTDKDKLIGEASRLLKKGGIVAFTDWVEGPAGLNEAEAARFNAFMKFPDLQSIPGYKALLEKHGFEVREAEKIEFAKYVDLYLTMLTEQLMFDALRILGGATGPRV
jgi:ubiquinone/menaquinone biosynthesis C-methylase UbiE